MKTVCEWWNNGELAMRLSKDEVGQYYVDGKPIVWETATMIKGLNYENALKVLEEETN